MRHRSGHHKIGQAQHLGQRRARERDLVHDEYVDTRMSECGRSLPQEHLHIADDAANAIAKKSDA
jgi:hypothetical protein